MSKIRFSKGELKEQRDSLARFQRYLPSLQLKKRQLQMHIREVREAAAAAEAREQALQAGMEPWSGLLGGQEDIFRGWVVPERVVTEERNIAGTLVPVLKEVVFADMDYDLYDAPVWFDRAVVLLREFFKVVCERKVLLEQARRLEQELRVTSQRVNLFEKVKIPECHENIRIIRIYLGDQQVSAVGIGKVAKKKLELAGV